MPAPFRNLKQRDSILFITALIVMVLFAQGGEALAQERHVVLNCSTGTHVVKSGRFDCANARGGSLTYSMTTSPSTLNPVTTADRASSTLQDHIFGVHVNSYSQLATGPDGLQPQAAANIEVNDAGNQITYTLRPNLRYSDGSPASGMDVLYWYYDVILNPNLPNAMSGRYICPQTGEPFEVVSPSDNSVVVRCPAPFGQFTAIAGTLLVMSQEMAEELISDQGISTEPGRINGRATREFLGLDADLGLIRGLGPFVLSELVPRASVQFVRNEFFYEYDSAGTRLPYLDEIEIIIEPSGGSQTALNHFTTGRTDLMIPRRQDTGPIFSLSFQGARINSDLNNGTAKEGLTFLTFNYDDENSALAQAVRNPNVRHALSLAIDRLGAINNTFFGFGTPQYVPVGLSERVADAFFVGRDNTCSTFSSLGIGCDTNKNILNARGVRIQADLLPPPGLSEQMDDHLSCLSGMEGCINQANAILNSEGLTTSGGGFRKLPNGEDFRIEITTNIGNLDRLAYAQFICNSWRNLDIDCTTNTVSFSELVSRLLGVGGTTWSGAIVAGLVNGNPLNNSNVFRCGSALYFVHQSCSPSASSGSAARAPGLAAVEEAFVASLNTSTFSETRQRLDAFQAAWSESEPFILLGIETKLFAVRTDRICNDGREITANDDVKFRVDVTGNAGSCSSNQGR